MKFTPQTVIPGRFTKVTLTLPSKLHPLNLIPIYCFLIRSTQKISFSPKSKCKLRPHYGKTRILSISLLEKCSYSEIFWSFISRIWTKYGQILRISLYSVQMLENTDQKNSEYGLFSCSVFVLKILNFENKFETESSLPNAP